MMNHKKMRETKNFVEDTYVLFQKKFNFACFDRFCTRWPQDVCSCIFFDSFMETPCKGCFRRFPLWGENFSKIAFFPFFHSILVSESNFVTYQFLGYWSLRDHQLLHCFQLCSFKNVLPYATHGDMKKPSSEKN